MLFTEWNMKDALKVSREEGIAIGEARGVAIGEARGTANMEKMLSLLESGVSLSEAKRQLGLEASQ